MKYLKLILFNPLNTITNLIFKINNYGLAVKDEVE